MASNNTWNHRTHFSARAVERTNGQRAGWGSAVSAMGSRQRGRVIGLVTASRCTNVIGEFVSGEVVGVARIDLRQHSCIPGGPFHDQAVALSPQFPSRFDSSRFPV